jgi:MFS family permease
VSGALCVAGGIGVLIEAHRDEIGTLDQLGPGFYPAVLGVLLIMVGALIGTAALSGGHEREDAGHEAVTAPDWRGCVCIVGGVIAFMIFAWLAGLAPAIFVCVFISALGDRTATLRGSAILATTMAVVGTVLFGFLLGINMPLWLWRFAS